MRISIRIIIAMIAMKKFEVIFSMRVLMCYFYLTVQKYAYTSKNETKEPEKRLRVTFS